MEQREYQSPVCLNKIKRLLEVSWAVGVDALGRHYNGVGLECPCLQHQKTHTSAANPLAFTPLRLLHP